MDAHTGKEMKSIGNLVENSENNIFPYEIKEVKAHPFISSIFVGGGIEGTISIIDVV